jgi:hypothetical protein
VISMISRVGGEGTNYLPEIAEYLFFHCWRRF